MSTFQKEFLQFIKELDSNYYNNNQHKSYIGKFQKNRKKEIHNQLLADVTISNVMLEEIKFMNCDFKNVLFINIDFDTAEFYECRFYTCNFKNALFKTSFIVDCRFIQCELFRVEFVSTELSNITFSNCNRLYYINLNQCYIFQLCFENCILCDSILRHCATSTDIGITFDSTNLYDVSFSNLNMSEFYFQNCILSRLEFNNSQLSVKTLKDKRNIAEDVNLIDIQTILHSTIDDYGYKLFGVNASADPKEYIKSLTTEVKFQSVFISYSFQNSAFAKYLNEKIRLKGLNTFLWEHDAPGGKRLKKIMQEYVRKYDRVLFIASENSLKSQACHFELSEARDIQDKEWKDIYFPIHIDDYLFKLEKDDIRPKENRDEYWKNIEEIKDFNSVDFSAFRNNYENNPEFDEKVSKLVKDLRV